MIDSERIGGLFLSSRSDVETAYTALSVTGQDPAAEAVLGSYIDAAREENAYNSINVAIPNEMGESFRRGIACALGIVIEYKSEIGIEAAREQELLERLDS